MHLESLCHFLPTNDLPKTPVPHSSQRGSRTCSAKLLARSHYNTWSNAGQPLELSDTSQCRRAKHSSKCLCRCFLHIFILFCIHAFLPAAFGVLYRLFCRCKLSPADDPQQSNALDQPIQRRILEVDVVTGGATGSAD